MSENREWRLEFFRGTASARFELNMVLVERWAPLAGSGPRWGLLPGGNVQQPITDMAIARYGISAFAEAVSQAYTRIQKHL